MTIETAFPIAANIVYNSEPTPTPDSELFFVVASTLLIAELIVALETPRTLAPRLHRLDSSDRHHSRARIRAAHLAAN